MKFNAEKFAEMLSLAEMLKGCKPWILSPGKARLRSQVLPSKLFLNCYLKLPLPQEFLDRGGLSCLARGIRGI